MQHQVPPPPAPRRHQKLLAAVIIVAGIGALVGITQLANRSSDKGTERDTASRSVQYYKDQASAQRPRPASDADVIAECQAGVRNANQAVSYDFDRMATAATDYGWLVGGRVRPSGGGDWLKLSCRVTRLQNDQAKFLDFRTY